MPTGFAITAILSLALSIASLRLASDVKFLRLRWMDLLGVLDVESNRDHRKAQERQMAMICLVLFVLFAAASLSFAYWTVAEVREAKRDKSPLEHELEMSRREVEDMRRRIGGA